MSPSSTQIAKAALHRLATSRLEPTPENYARAWAEEGGAAQAVQLPERARALVERLAQRVSDDATLRADLSASLMQGRWDDLSRAIERSADAASAQTRGWANLIERISRGLERGSSQWTSARRKESLQRVLDGSGGDAQRLLQRLRQLVTSWERDVGAAAGPELADTAATAGATNGDDTTLETQTLAPAAVGRAGTPSHAAELAGNGASAPSTAPDGARQPAASVAPDGASQPAAAAPGRASEPPASAAPRNGSTLQTQDSGSAGAPNPTTARSAVALTEPTAWPHIVSGLSTTVQAALPEGEPRAVELANELAVLANRIALEGATVALAAEVNAVCQRARRLLAHRHHLLDQLSALCRELTAGLTELAEDRSWAQGQTEAMQQRLSEGVSARGIKAASDMLAQTRRQQQALREERDRARDALKGLMQSFLAQLGDLGDQTGRFSERLGHYGDVIQRADSVDQLSGLVRDMLEDSRAVHSRVQQTQQRLGDEHARASQLEGRVRDLEGELRRLSDEVSTDALTEVANRRGLMKAFEAERARLQRHGGDLAVGLLDIDNFKKLNDTLGHSAGDVALKSLAERVRSSLRPVDLVARYGGEEFVVLLPGTPVDEAQQVLTRLQRSLSASLFMHDGREVFVTFSAGVTAYRLDEEIDPALERADEALYEAKRTGKNRTCIA